jgi:hypothetical protein
LAPRQAEFVRIPSGPRDEGRAAGSPAGLAVTMRDSRHLSPRPIPNGAAQTAAFYWPIWFHDTHIESLSAGGEAIHAGINDFLTMFIKVLSRALSSSADNRF